jgi:low temperature requirement protein LtrA
MATSGAAGVLRTPEAPQRATFLELFFDLVFVFALTRISQRLVDELTTDRAVSGRLVEGVGTLVLLLALYSVWAITAGMTDQLDPEQPKVQLLVVTTMLGSLVMAVAVPAAYGERGLVFAGAYVAIQTVRGLFLMFALRGHELQRLGARLLFWAGVSAGPWLAGALFSAGMVRWMLWTLAIAVDYTAPGFGWPTPGLGRTPLSAYPVVAEHVSERYRQFFIIALGESILVIGFTFSSVDFGAARDAAFLVSFATTALLWRIYIYRAGELLGPAIAASHEPSRSIRLASYAHLLMVAGIVAIAVGDDLVIEHPSGHAQPAWIAVILGGPGLFLAGRAVFEYAVFARVSRPRMIGLLVLAVVSPAMVLLPPLAVAIVAAVVLLGIAVSDGFRAKGRPAEEPSPPS